jgi:hypothetical protein
LHRCHVRGDSKWKLNHIFTKGSGCLDNSALTSTATTSATSVEFRPALSQIPGPTEQVLGQYLLIVFCVGTHNKLSTQELSGISVSCWSFNGQFWPQDTPQPPQKGIIDQSRQNSKSDQYLLQPPQDFSLFIVCLLFTLYSLLLFMLVHYLPYVLVRFSSLSF